jgi:hypothetical protein
MIHSLLGGIPELIDAEPEFHDTGNNEGTVTEVDRAAEDQTVSIARSRSDGGGACTHEQPSSEAIDETLGSPNISKQSHVSCDTFTGDEDEPNQSTVPLDVVQTSGTLRSNSSSPSTNSIPLPDATGQNCAGDPHSSALELAASLPLPDSRPASPIPSPGPPSPVQSTMTLPQEARFVGHHNPSPSTSDQAPRRPRSPSSDPARPSSPMQSPTVENGPTSDFDKSAPSKPRTKPAPLSLTYLLRQADDLLTACPPSHPSLRVTEILGPDSAMRTWRPLSISTKFRNTVPEKQPYNYTDDYLETLVDSPYIVIPSPPPSPPLGRRHPAKKTKTSPRALSRPLLDPRRIGLRLGALTPAERRMLFMGALLVVGAAMALRAGKVPCVDGIVKTSGGDGLKRLWNGKWTLATSVVAAWGRGLP